MKKHHFSPIRWGLLVILFLFSSTVLFSQKKNSELVLKSKNPQEIFGNPDILAFSYSSYRQNSRKIEPTIDEIKEDLRIMKALGVKLIRTYNSQQYDHSKNILNAIKSLQQEDSKFEMYVMLGTWIECEGAWGSNPNHELGNTKNNSAEIEQAIALTQQYPEIIKAIAVGNEAMVHWASSYFVAPKVILKWVNYLQAKKKEGKLPANIWITSSDNFASWGGGDTSYHNSDLAQLIKSVDFISLHTYPFHDTFYNPSFWAIPENEAQLSATEKIDGAMQRSINYAISQYQNTQKYLKSIGISKPIHIGETGWASNASTNYGATGSMAADEYKAKKFYDLMRAWTKNEHLSCFYFELFDEKWKNSTDAGDSENHFGLIDLDNKVKYALWNLFDNETFKNLTRNGKPLIKSFDGDQQKLLNQVQLPPLQSEIGVVATDWINANRKTGAIVTELNYLVFKNVDANLVSKTYPSASLKPNAWDGTCGIKLTQNGTLIINTGSGAWWGCALEMQSGGRGENLNDYKNGYLHFEIKGTTASSFKIGFQSGVYAKGTQVNHGIIFGKIPEYKLTNEWVSYQIPISKLMNGSGLNDVTSPLFLLGDGNFDGKIIEIRKVFYSKN